MKGEISSVFTILVSCDALLCRIFIIIRKAPHKQLHEHFSDFLIILAIRRLSCRGLETPYLTSEVHELK